MNFYNFSTTPSISSIPHIRRLIPIKLYVACLSYQRSIDIKQELKMDDEILLGVGSQKEPIKAQKPESFDNNICVTLETLLNCFKFSTTEP